MGLLSLPKKEWPSSIINKMKYLKNYHIECMKIFEENTRRTDKNKNKIVLFLFF